MNAISSIREIGNFHSLCAGSPRNAGLNSGQIRILRNNSSPIDVVLTSQCKSCTSKLFLTSHRLLANSNHCTILHDNNSFVAFIVDNTTIFVYLESNVLCVLITSRSTCFTECVSFSCNEFANDFVRFALNRYPFINLVIVLIQNNQSCTADFLVACDVSLGNGNSCYIILHDNNGFVAVLVNDFTICIQCEFNVLRISITVRSICFTESISFIGSKFSFNCVRFAFNRSPSLNDIAILVKNCQDCTADFLVACDVSLGDCYLCDNISISHDNNSFVAFIVDNTTIFVYLESNVLCVLITSRSTCFTECVSFSCNEFANDFVRFALNRYPFINLVIVLIQNNQSCTADFLVACDVSLGNGNSCYIILHDNNGFVAVLVNDFTICIQCEFNVLRISITVRSICFTESISFIGSKFSFNCVRFAFNRSPSLDDIAILVKNCQDCTANFLGTGNICLGDSYS